jgi:hypothetical protein
VSSWKLKIVKGPKILGKMGKEKPSHLRNKFHRG